MMAHRDFCLRPVDPPRRVSPREDWRALLRRKAPLGEQDGLRLLADYGIPSLPAEIVESEAAAVATAERLGFPVVLKTAAPGVLHKTERGGVKLGLADAAAVRIAYADLASRLGPQVLVTRMAPHGVELALGLTIDPQFGPLVMVGAGGVLIEILRDAEHALAPFGPLTARRLLDRLRVRKLLDGVRGAAPADIASLADAIARFSVLAADLSDELAEIDVNPLLAGPAGVLALDALVVPKP
jgi:succinyl-CoA synthetase beta subunit